MTQDMFTCQWPGCTFFASAQMKRGERVEFMYLCTHHSNQFMCMTNAECADVSKRRQPPQKIRVGVT